MACCQALPSRPPARRSSKRFVPPLLTQKGCSGLSTCGPVHMRSPLRFQVSARSNARASSLLRDSPATVNGDLRVSNLEETVTVTGQTPLIDSQNVTQRRAMTSVIIDALPTAKTFQSISTLVPGVKTPISSQDVGGSAGQSWQVLSVHGSRADQMPINHDGMPYNNMNNTGGGYNTDIQLNSGMIQEISVATGGLSAESKVSGAVTNIIPKEGGNAFRGYFFGNYTNDKFQTDNLSPRLVARGMRAANSVDKIWDVNPAGGGRILRGQALVLRQLPILGIGTVHCGRLPEPDAARMAVHTRSQPTARHLLRQMESE